MRALQICTSKETSTEGGKIVQGKWRELRQKTNVYKTEAKGYER